MPTDIVMPRELVIKSVKKQEEVDVSIPEKKEEKTTTPATDKPAEDDVNFAI
jgi:hypothetical protein